MSQPTTSAVRRGAVVVATGLSILALAACGGGGAHHASAPTAGPDASPASHLVATRWWSNGAALRDSVIDTNDPGSVAAKLQPSRSGYCSMLSQTLAAGKSILPGVTANDPALAVATIAFVDELSKLAPAPVNAPWKTVGPVVIAVARSQGNLGSVKNVDQRAVATAVTAISADAKAQCHLDLSAHS